MKNPQVIHIVILVIIVRFRFNFFSNNNIIQFVPILGIHLYSRFRRRATLTSYFISGFAYISNILWWQMCVWIENSSGRAKIAMNSCTERGLEDLTLLAVKKDYSQCVEIRSIRPPAHLIIFEILPCLLFYCIHFLLNLARLLLRFVGVSMNVS